MAKEIHPNWYYDVPGMKALVIGSFPPHKKQWSYEFYYPNKQNRLWRVLAKIAKVELKHFTGSKAIVERKRIMRSLKLGIHNLGEIIDRKGESSLDRDIEILKCHDMISMVRKHKKLQTIILTGYSDRHSAYKSFLRYLNENDIEYVVPKSIKAGDTFTINIDRPIECLVVNSTSPLVAYLGVDDLVSQFKKGIR